MANLFWSIYRFLREVKTSASFLGQSIILSISRIGPTGDFSYGERWSEVGGDFVMFDIGLLFSERKGKSFEENFVCFIFYGFGT